MPAIKWDFGGMFIEIRNRLRVVFSSARGLNYFFHPPSIGHGCDEGSLSAGRSGFDSNRLARFLYA